MTYSPPKSGCSSRTRAAPEWHALRRVEHERGHECSRHPSRELYQRPVPFLVEHASHGVAGDRLQHGDRAGMSQAIRMSDHRGREPTNAESKSHQCARSRPMLACGSADEEVGVSVASAARGEDPKTMTSARAPPHGARLSLRAKREILGIPVEGVVSSTGML